MTSPIGLSDVKSDMMDMLTFFSDKVVCPASQSIFQKNESIISDAF